MVHGAWSSSYCFLLLFPNYITVVKRKQTYEQEGGGVEEDARGGAEASGGTDYGNRVKHYMPCNRVIGVINSEDAPISWINGVSPIMIRMLRSEAS